MSALEYSNISITPPPLQPIVIKSAVGGSSDTGGYVLTSDLFAFGQTEKYSTWDLNFTSWPSAQPTGNWYYYCPDEDCSLGVGWFLLKTPFLLNVRFRCHPRYTRY